MNQLNDFETIYKIASRLRKHFEKVYYKYKNEYQWWYGLGGMCGICSYHLFKELRKNNIRAHFCQNNGHAFIMVDDYIVDITATQFDSFLDKVMIINKNETNETHWEFDEKISSLKDLNNIFQDFQNWPNEQNPIILEGRLTL